jgi:preprotein translocase subunit SecA
VLTLLTRLFGSRNDRIVKGYEATAQGGRIRDGAAGIERRSPERRTVEFRKRLAEVRRCRPAPEGSGGPRSRAAQDAPLRRALIGGLTLNDGRIAEARTGEGKTLMSTLAAI